MIENQSSSKKQRTDFHPGRDMLSELPLSIIHMILALVPIRDAVKTSILSKQWRYTWASLPHLVFKEDISIGHYKSREEYEDYMENFITHVLVSHKGPIHTFRLSVQFSRHCRNIGIWLFCMFRNDIRELIIHVGRPYYTCTQELPSSIYSCKKLTKLVLSNCKLDPPPTTFRAFLHLRCLFLRDVDLSTDEVESFVANCPLLEDFDFTSVEFGSSELRFSAPNLKFLHAEGYFAEISVYAPLLAELEVELRQDGGFTDHSQQQNSSACNYIDFLGGFINLEYLCGDIYFTKFLSMGIESCTHTLVFHCLKVIELDEVHFEDIKQIAVAARLILGAPNLEKLKISDIDILDKDDDAPEPEVPNVSFDDFGCSPSFKLEKLRVVKMKDITGLPPQMAFIRFLLERSPVLESMGFCVPSREEKQNLSAALEGCSRAFPNVKLAMISSSQYFD